MLPTLHVGLIGDRDLSVTAHLAIEQALPLTAAALGISLKYEWLTTDSINAECLPSFNGLWCVPASPYRDTDAVLAAIRYAREHATPFLGTCGGFQHALLEYAQNALGWSDAEHGELPSQGGRAVIAPLSCALIEARQSIRLAEGSHTAQAYGISCIEEGTAAAMDSTRSLRLSYLMVLCALPVGMKTVKYGWSNQQVSDFSSRPYFSQNV